MGCCAASKHSVVQDEPVPKSSIILKQPDESYDTVTQTPRVVEVGYQNTSGTGVSPSEVKLGDARQLKMTMARNGFELVHFEHGVTDFSSEAQASGETEKQIKERLYPRFETLLLQACAGATDVIVFNHGLRASSVPQSKPQGTSVAPAVNPPVKEAHSDFSESISPLVAQNLAPDLDPQKNRYCLVNLWMSVDQENPVMKTPLGFLDAESVGKEDLLDAFVHSGGANEVKEWKGEMKPTFRAKLKQSEVHKHGWYYFPKMMKDEAVLFKQFDSTTTESQVCIHAAIDLEEDGPRPLPDRQSVEVRAIVLY